MSSFLSNCHIWDVMIFPSWSHFVWEAFFITLSWLMTLHCCGYRNHLIEFKLKSDYVFVSQKNCLFPSCFWRIWRNFHLFTHLISVVFFRYILESTSFELFFKFVELPNFDVASDAFSTFKVTLFPSLILCFINHLPLNL